MDFRIADTFTESLTRLTGDEQKAVKTTAFDLQMNAASPGMRFHKLDKAKDKNFWSVRVNRDIRIIVHKTTGSILLCYVAHHDKAYEWAERRKLEIHPKTGAAQMVVLRETVKEVSIYVQQGTPKGPITKPKLFADVRDDTLLSFGVPQEWMADVKEANEDTLLPLTEHLPSEAAEALFEYATGGAPLTYADGIPVRPGVEIHYMRSGPTDPFSHPDSQRRFRTINNLEELKQALDFPWDKWAIFLHPAQRQLVGKTYSGPARVSGSAGTGKTVVALHRAVFLAKTNSNARVLLTTFSGILANALRVKLRRLISNEPQLAERLETHPINEIGLRLYRGNIGNPKIASQEQILNYITEASAKAEQHKFSASFLMAEWSQVVDAWQLEAWEDYRDVKRLGRKTRLPEQQRVILWSIFSDVILKLKEQNELTLPNIFNSLTEFILKSKRPPFDCVVVDESQDIAVYHLRFLSALGSNRPNALFFAGDLGQRIFQQPFSWRSLGVNIRGRAKTLHVNYRTSHQIRRQADLLLGPEVTDADGNIETRKHAVSVFNGPEPTIEAFQANDVESEFVGKWVAKLFDEGVAAHEIGVFVRSASEIERAVAALEEQNAPYKVLDDRVEAISGQVAICTMHLAKGLEFKAVAVMACDDEVIPLQERIETVTDDADLEEVYNTERHLLYVACTRARDQLLVTGVQPASEFLDDIRSKK